MMRQHGKTIVWLAMTGLLIAGLIFLWVQNQQLKNTLATLVVARQSMNHHSTVRDGVASTPLGQQASLKDVLPSQTSNACLPQLPLTPSTLKAICADHYSEPDDPLAGLSGTERSLAESAMKKYAALISNVSLDPSEMTALKRLLFQRESLGSAVLHGYFDDPEEVEQAFLEQEHKLMLIDEQVDRLLDLDDHHAYHLLKESDFQQYKLRQFTSTLPEGTISPQQEQRVLLSKLELSKAFDDSLAQIRRAERLTSTELKRLMSQYKAEFYRQSSAHLGTEEYNKLRAYEDAEFDALEKSLLRQLDQ